MIDGTRFDLPLVLLSILAKYSDASHHLSMPDLQAMLEEEHISAERRTVSRALQAINSRICPVHFTRAGRQGYYIDHLFSTSEVLFLTGAVREAPGLSADVSEELQQRIRSLLSETESSQVRHASLPVNKTDNGDVLSACETILEAVRLCHPIRFHYYDLSVTKQKTYRKNRKRYEQDPYAVILHQGRFYCICYSEHHKSFGNYRIDRMDHITVAGDRFDPVPFDLDAYCRASFDMYRGTLQTITVQFDRSLADYVRDAFGDNIVIRAIEEDTFTVSAATAVTPTLISWLLQFHDRSTVLGPPELIAQIRTIAETLRMKYSKEAQND